MGDFDWQLTRGIMLKVMFDFIYDYLRLDMSLHLKGDGGLKI